MTPVPSFLAIKSAQDGSNRTHINRFSATCIKQGSFAAGVQAVFPDFGSLFCVSLAESVKETQKSADLSAITRILCGDTNSGRPVVNSSGETSHQRSAQESDGLGVERSSFLTEQANWRLGGAADRNLLIRAAPELGHRASTHGVEQYGRVGHAVAV